MTTQVHKITVVVVDHDRLGAKAVCQELENGRFGNDCIFPSTLACETRAVEWSDEHPLNNSQTSAAAVAGLFGPSLPTARTDEEITAIVRKAEADWNASSDHMNGWHALSDLERAECIARAMVEFRPSLPAGNEAPFAWAVYIPSQQRQDLYDSLEDPQLIDDLTNCDDAELIPLYSRPKPSGDVAALREALEGMCRVHDAMGVPRGPSRIIADEALRGLGGEGGGA